jgi:hypothetical protein
VSDTQQRTAVVLHRLPDRHGRSSLVELELTD